MMADKDPKSPQPLAPAYAYPRSNDTEAVADHNAKEMKKKKRMKCLLYVFMFAVFQIGVITLFSMTVMKVKTPKFRLRQATLANYNAGASSLSAALSGEFSVKNTNFGRFKYDATTVEFFYSGAKIGQALVPKSKAGWRSTKKISFTGVDLNLSGGPQLTSHLSGGAVPITSSARMSGKVELMFIMKKKKSTNMNCSMDIVTATRTIENIACK